MEFSMTYLKNKKTLTK